MEAKAEINTIEITNLLKRISKKQKAVITKSLNRVSNMAVMMITKRTQAGKLPDGGKMRSYAKSSVRSRKKRGRQTGFVDLTDKGKKSQTLEIKKKEIKSTLFFSNKKKKKIASYHDTFGVGKSKITRPFFSIGDKEEIKLKDEFAKFYFKEMRL